MSKLINVIEPTQSKSWLSFRSGSNLRLRLDRLRAAENSVPNQITVSHWRHRRQRRQRRRQRRGEISSSSVSTYRNNVELCREFSFGTSGRAFDKGIWGPGLKSCWERGFFFSRTSSKLLKLTQQVGVFWRHTRQWSAIMIYRQVTVIVVLDSNINKFATCKARHLSSRIRTAT